MATPKGRGRLWQALLGIAISAVFLYWALKGISFAQVAAQMRAADPWRFVLSVLLVTLTFPARAIRWQFLLGAASGTLPPFRPTWLATAIGFMANNILPARAGEVARAYAGSRLLDQPVSTVFSTIAVERIFDGAVIVLLLALGIAAPGFPADVRLPGGARLTSIAVTMGAACAAALLLLTLVAARPGAALRLWDRVARAVLPERLARWAGGVVGNLVTGLSVLRSGHAFGRVLLWSFVVWLLNAASYVAAYQAFHLDTLPLTAAIVMQGIVAFVVAAPSSPGFVGVFEAACIVALGIYGIPRETAAGFALALHMAWFVPITVLGLWALVRAGLTMSDIRTKPAGT